MWKRPGQMLGGLALIALVWFLAGNVATAREIPDELTVASVSAFADAEIPGAMRAGQIPGAVFVVVRGGQVLCEKAYGVADLKDRRPVTTDDTLFRVASISKIFTAASVLQLVQAGRLDLHRDVNDYLTRFQITPEFHRPVTLFNLLTHTSGFDESVFGYAACSAAQKLSLGAYLEQHQPARVRPPGLFSIYDNYGFALAGYLVQQAAGMPFKDYVRQRVLDPLDMEHTSFSPGPTLRAELATGYWLEGDAPRACGPDYVNIQPAAGLCTTAADMSEFLKALLTDQRPDGARMFSTSVLQGLTTQQFAADSEVPGRCFGFNRITLAGRSALRQPGQWLGFNSVLLLFPKQNCGVFLSYNLCDYAQLERQICRDFAEKFIVPDLAPAIPASAPLATKTDQLKALTGSYRSSRTAHDEPALTFPKETSVAIAANGFLEIDGSPYREIEPLVFEKILTNDTAGMLAGSRVAFRPGNGMEPVRMITQGSTYRRANWLESRPGRRVWMLTVTLILFSVIMAWPVIALRRQFFSGNASGSGWSMPGRRAWFSVAARVTALVTCALALWFEISLGWVESRLKPFADFFGFPAAIANLLWALPVLLVLTVALTLFAVIIWHRRLWHPIHRVHYTLVALACGMFVYFFYTRHLLTFG